MFFVRSAWIAVQEAIGNTLLRNGRRRGKVVFVARFQNGDGMVSVALGCRDVVPQTARIPSRRVSNPTGDSPYPEDANTLLAFSGRRFPIVADAIPPLPIAAPVAIAHPGPSLPGDWFRTSRRGFSRKKFARSRCY